MKKVAAVVVTYNRKELLSENIKALMQQTKTGEQDIIIIDKISVEQAALIMACVGQWKLDMNLFG